MCLPGFTQCKWCCSLMLSNAHAAICKKTVNERFHTVNAWKRTFKQCWTRRTPPNNCVQDASKSDKPLRGGCPFSRTAMQQHIQTEHTSCSAAGRKSRNARNAYAATLAVATTHQKGCAHALPWNSVATVPALQKWVLCNTHKHNQ